MKYFKITFLILVIWVDIEAAGIFNLGLMAGAVNDAGNVEKLAGDINVEMRSDTTATVTDIETSYSPVLSVNLAYISDTLLIKTGWEYTTNTFYNSAGSIENAGGKNKIELDYSRYTFPLSLGIVIPLADRYRLYFAGGFNMSYVQLIVKQSNPAAVPLSYYHNESHTFGSFVTGTHVKFGAEALLRRNYTFGMEITRYFGNTKKIESIDGTSDIIMSVNSFEITAGLNYNLDLKI